jgi:hypothetical protein
MKKTILMLLLGFSFYTGKSQQKSNIDSVLKAMDYTAAFDLLEAPASPAFNLMGISPSSIERPTSLNSFRLSIQNATSNFSKFPSNYSAEFAPASIFNIKDQTLAKFNSTKLYDVFWQSFSVSFGFTRTNSNDTEKEDSTMSAKLGIGLKFSIIRPHWDDSTQKYIDSITYYLDYTIGERKKWFLTHPAILKIDDSIRAVNNSPSLTLNQKIDSINNLGNRKTLVQVSLTNNFDKVDSLANKNLKRLANSLKITRKGPFLDFATGLVLDFPDDRFDNSRVAKAGAWLTGGYENGAKGLSVLGIGRYLYQPDKIFADDSGKIKSKNISTLDGGARLAYSGAQGKFSVSAEAIYRSVLNDNVIKPSWRFTFNAEYSVGFNQKITFALGRNFNGAITKSGNLIAALNFIKGFGGGNKKIGNPAQN